MKDHMSLCSYVRKMLSFVISSIIFVVEFGEIFARNLRIVCYRGIFREKLHHADSLQI